jgi:hypothetical protein
MDGIPEELTSRRTSLILIINSNIHLVQLLVSSNYTIYPHSPVKKIKIVVGIFNFQ